MSLLFRSEPYHSSTKRAPGTFIVACYLPLCRKPHRCRSCSARTTIHKGHYVTSSRTYGFPWIEPCRQSLLVLWRRRWRPLKGCKSSCKIGRTRISLTTLSTLLKKFEHSVLLSFTEDRWLFCTETVSVMWYSSWRGTISWRGTPSLVLTPGQHTSLRTSSMVHSWGRSLAPCSTHLMLSRWGCKSTLEARSAVSRVWPTLCGENATAKYGNCSEGFMWTTHGPLYPGELWMLLMNVSWNTFTWILLLIN